MSFLEPLQSWSKLDTWIVVVGALAAMACALPGSFLLLRRQSLMGDAISHTSLLGIVAGFVVSQGLVRAGWIAPSTEPSIRHLAMCAGAVVVGVLSAWLTESLQKLGNVESSAALGVVFTSLFALGLLLLRAIADNVDLDPDCVLYGTIETTVLETVGGSGVPRAVVVNAVVLVFNLLLTIGLFKELRLSAFDPALGTTVGIPAHVMHYGLMGITAMTLVAAFESVGSILVIAMLIVPPATAYLLTDRLPRLIGLSVFIAALSSLLGHVGALTLPPLIFDVSDASTAGMMAAAVGFLFVLAMCFGPRYGLLSRWCHHGLLKLRIAGEDVLGRLYRLEETPSSNADVERIANLPHVAASPDRATTLRDITTCSLWARLATSALRWRGWIVGRAAELHLTERGREAARQLVRSHRLWESFLAKHFVLGEGHFHESAEQVEHFLDGELIAELDQDLDRPGVDPHGRSIPGHSE
jgi:manganese/zinc/iron transport system permease protein